MRRSVWTLLVAAVAALSLGVAACGGGGGSGGSNTGEKGTAKGAPVAGKTGGKLTVLWTDDVDFIDCGETYYQMGFFICQATQKSLYGYKPTDGTHMVPDLAESLPQVSSDGKTVTIKIKPNVMYAPPLSRAVTTADVKYAFERLFNPNVPSGYAGSYYPIVGADKAKGGPIKGIETPDKTTIVFHLTSDFGATFVQALTLPGSAPVPKDVAGPMDKHSPTTYDSDVTKQAFSGPYMISSYSSDRSLTLVRNPNWKADTDYRPAYADKIVWKAGGDPNVLARQTLSSPNLIMADGPPASVLKTAYQQHKDQLSISTLGQYYASLNTTRPPFDDINLRKAAIAISDRNAYLLARGGKLVGQVATHYLGPEVPGFAESGGEKGFGVDYMSNPGGNQQVACKYMKAAGYGNCKYTGTEKVVIVGSNADPGPKEMQIVESGLRKLGFNTEIKAVPQQTMYSKFCGYTKAEYNVCPTAGWIEDFPDPYAYLYVPFSGKAIVPVNNVNWAQLDDPDINKAMDAAAKVTDPAQRRQAWADINKMLVEAAPAIPEVWSSNALVKGTTVKAVLDKWNDDWNLSFSSPQ